MSSTVADSGLDQIAPEKQEHTPVVESINTNTTAASTHSRADIASQSGDKDRTLWQNIKRYRKIAYITLGMTSAILLYGYDNVIVGTVTGMPGFQYVYLLILPLLDRNFQKQMH
jgi:hypothetical protein